LLSLALVAGAAQATVPDDEARKAIVDLRAATEQQAQGPGRPDPLT
jgi:hypothetical protein